MDWLKEKAQDLRLRIEILADRFSYSRGIRRGYGVTAIRNRREAKALIYFCKNSRILDDPNQNDFRIKIFKNTVRPYEGKRIRKCPCNRCEPSDRLIFSDYVDAHVGWYWD